MKNFLAHTDEIRKQMLDEISLASVEDLFKQIPLKFKDFNLYNPKSEMETQKEIKKLARKNNEVTNFGKLVDAIADKVLVNSVLIIFACQGFISAVVPVVIIVRDIVVDAIRMICANNGKVQAAKLSGKIKTATLMVGVILTFFYNLPFQIWGYRVSDFFLYFGTIMSVVSMFEYYNLNKKIIFQEFEEK